jgi:hypothetical protein
MSAGNAANADKARFHHESMLAFVTTYAKQFCLW